MKTWKLTLTRIAFVEAENEDEALDAADDAELENEDLTAEEVKDEL